MTKDKLAVRVKFIQVFNSVNVEKIFIIKDFFQNYPFVLSNQKKTKMKSYFIELVKVFEQDHRILFETHNFIQKGSNFWMKL